MRSIPTIFVWDANSRTVINKQLKMVDWVFQGKGVPTRKWDGIAIKVEGNKVFRRHEWHTGEDVPLGFIKLQDPDPKRPHAAIPGWVLVPETFLTNPQGPDEKALKQAWEDQLRQLTQAKLLIANKTLAKSANIYAPAPELHPVTELPNGTYELCGPSIRKNHENFKNHVLLRHGAEVVKHVPRSYEGLKKFLETYEGEGIVWHYNLSPDSVRLAGNSITLMAKIKRRDFGFYTRISREDLQMAYKQSREEQAVEFEESLKEEHVVQA